MAPGARLGGNVTLAGAWANVLEAYLAERSGYPISFRLLLDHGLITMAMSLLPATAFMLLCDP